jgi:hypothetical protein
MKSIMQRLRSRWLSEEGLALLAASLTGNVFVDIFSAEMLSAVKRYQSGSVPNESIRQQEKDDFAHRRLPEGGGVAEEDIEAVPGFALQAAIRSIRR